MFCNVGVARAAARGSWLNNAILSRQEALERSPVLYQRESFSDQRTITNRVNTSSPAKEHVITSPHCCFDQLFVT